MLFIMMDTYRPVGSENATLRNRTVKASDALTCFNNGIPCIVYVPYSEMAFFAGLGPHMSLADNIFRDPDTGKIGMTTGDGTSYLENDNGYFDKFTGD